MARFGITKMTNTIQFRRVGTCIGGCKKLLQEDVDHVSKLKGIEDNVDQKVSSSSSSSWWVPHHRTGIYYPRGHEAVMDDVPDGAASLQGTTFWFRNIEGVDVINLE